MKNKIQLGSKLLKLRQEKGYKQMVIAELLNISQGTISNIENNQLSLNQHQIQKLASFFNVPVSFFFDEECDNQTKAIKPEPLKEIQAILTDFKETVTNFKTQLKNKDMIIDFQQEKINFKMEMIIDLESKLKKNEDTLTQLLNHFKTLNDKPNFNLAEFSRD